MKLKITSESCSQYDTRVVNAETGEEVKGITSITLTAAVNAPWVAQITFLPESVDVIALLQDGAK